MNIVGQSGHGHFGQNRFSGNEHRNFKDIVPHFKDIVT